ncbi:MAG: nucleotide sugar dehydrogenase [Alphaproteobacteria bacterium]|nr:nucleotide sugar dehydrogenase [Alphaproteobacteria bacterium]
MRISVIGLGKLGAPLAAVLSSKGFEVVGADLNQGFVDAINQGKAPVVEPRLQEKIDIGASRLSATTSVEEAALKTEASFIIVPTPTGPDGTFVIDYVLAAAEQIAKAIAKKSSYHLVSLTSTVMPGDTEKHVKPLLEKVSGKKCGQDFGLCYNPEFIALGNVINDMLNPDFILIGQSDPHAGDIVESIYNVSCDKPPTFARMNFINAELSKISLNSYVTLRISFANQLARLCDHLPGADVDVVTGALGLDSRIGKKYLKGAVSFGGPCFPRDNIAFSKLALNNGTEAPIATTTDYINDSYLAYLAEKMQKHLPAGGTIGLLGLSYKPETSVVEASPSLKLARLLIARSVPVVAYDPQAMPEAQRQISEGIVYVPAMAECAAQADLLAVLVAWPEFKSLTPKQLKNQGKDVVLFDYWRILPRQDFERAGCRYFASGQG